MTALAECRPPEGTPDIVNVARSPARAARRWQQGKRATNPMQPNDSPAALAVASKERERNAVVAAAVARIQEAIDRAFFRIGEAFARACGRRPDV